MPRIIAPPGAICHAAASAAVARLRHSMTASPTAVLAPVATSSNGPPDDAVGDEARQALGAIGSGSGHGLNIAARRPTTGVLYH